MPTLFNCLPSCQALANCQHTHIHTHTHLQAGKHNGIAGDPGIGLVLAASSLGGCAVGGAVGGGSKGKRGTFALNVFAFGTFHASIATQAKAVSGIGRGEGELILILLQKLCVDFNDYLVPHNQLRGLSC